MVSRRIRILKPISASSSSSSASSAVESAKNKGPPSTGHQEPPGGPVEERDLGPGITQPAEDNLRRDGAVEAIRTPMAAERHSPGPQITLR